MIIETVIEILRMVSIFLLLFASAAFGSIGTKWLLEKLFPQIIKRPHNNPAEDGKKHSLPQQ